MVARWLPAVLAGQRGVGGVAQVGVAEGVVVGAAGGRQAAAPLMVDLTGAPEP